jgi:hypothetical protein
MPTVSPATHRSRPARASVHSSPIHSSATHRSRPARAGVHSSPIHHRARLVGPAHCRPHRTLARLRYQPIDVMSRNESARRNCQDLGAARRAPGLNLSDLITIQHHSVTSAPPSECVHSSTRLYSQSRPYCLLYRHSDITFSSFLLLRGCPKIYENLRALSRTIFDQHYIIFLTYWHS